MISNARMAEMYGNAHSRVEAGWVQRDLYSGTSVCLVGAINVSSRFAEEQLTLQADVADTLIHESTYARFFANLAKRSHPVFSTDIDGHPVGPDGGIAFVERWNDRRFRRKATVLKLLADRRDHFTALAKNDRIEELERAVANHLRLIEVLRAEISELKGRIAALQEENAFFRRRALGQAEEDLVRSTMQISDTGDAYDAALAELEALRG